MKFNNYTYILPGMSFIDSLLLGFDNIILNDIAENRDQVFPKHAIYIKSKSTRGHYSSVSYVHTGLETAWLIIRSILFYFLVSITTSWYIYGTMLSSPTVIILALRISNYLRQGNA